MQCIYLKTEEITSHQPLKRIKCELARVSDEVAVSLNFEAFEPRDIQGARADVERQLHYGPGWSSGFLIIKYFRAHK